MGPTTPRRRILQRKKARSGVVDFVDQLVLHETRDSRIVVVPLFIPHATRESALTLKVIRQSKFEAESDTEINLGEEATQGLLQELPRLAELAGHSTGDYLVVPIDGDFNIANIAPETVAASLVRVLSDPSIAEQFANSNLSDELISALRSRLRLRALQAAVDELRDYLARGVSAEATYQNWCRRHAWAFGISHRDPDAVRLIAVGDAVDFLLPTLLDHRDIVELKRPNMPVLVLDPVHNNYFWSRDTSAAIGQCARYIEQLQEARIRDHPEIVAHHPRATIVIGRSQGWAPDQVRALVALNASLHGITVITFDMLLMQAERLIEIVTASPAA